MTKIGDIGETSDGYHTFNELYDHRNLLFINLCLLKPDLCAWRMDETTEGWLLLYCETTAGQISYHIPVKYLPLILDDIRYDHLHQYDGHDSFDVVDRLKQLAKGSK